MTPTADSISHVRECIEELDLDETGYLRLPHPQIKIKNGIGNKVLYRSLLPKANVQIDFSGSVNSTVFIGEDFAGTVELKVDRPECIIYFGNRVRLNSTSIKVRAPKNRLFVGNHVTTSGPNLWLVRSHNPAATDLVIGDDCMFSFNITLRNNDGHPLYDTTTWHETNLPHSHLLIEPHCWIGQGSSMLKNVRLGACSIVAMGSVVTKSAPRFSVVSGIPGTARSIDGRLWSRGGEGSRATALKYLQRYASPGSFTLPGTTVSAEEPPDDD